MPIEDILPLSRLQEGLLFHALYEAHGPDVYTTQRVLELSGSLDEGALRAAATALLGRHASLRAAFEHVGLSRPVQVIVSGVAAPWRSVDLSGLSDAARAARLSELVASDRGERFELSRAPLVRFLLIRLGALEHRLVLTNHHIVMDGWSMPIVVRELLTLYRSGGSVSALGRLTPYREYLVWLSRQDREAALLAWGEALGGLAEGSLLAPQVRGRSAVMPELRS
jgi:hypothetical protein